MNAEHGSNPSPDSPSDEAVDHALIERLNAGDARAFEALYQRHRDWVIAAALRLSRNHDAALDVTQEVFLHWLRRFPPHAPPFMLRARVRTYLYTLTRSLVLTTARQRAARAPHLRSLAHTQPSFMADERQPSTERERALADALDSLDDIHREVLHLRYVDGLSIDEIALALSLPPGTVKSRLHHALHFLRGHPVARDYFFQNP